MALKFVCLVACLAVARASVLHQPLAYAAAPVAVANTVVDTEYDANPQYTYSYGVHDSVTGDIKGQVESRNGDLVTGQYSLVDSDGTKRTVDYSADSVNGFNAVVSKTPLATHTVVAAAPAVETAPAVVAARTVAAPAVTYAANAPFVSAYSAPSVVARTVATHAPVAYNSYSTHVASAPAVYARTVAAPVAYNSYPAVYANTPVDYAAQVAGPAGVVSTYNTPGVVSSYNTHNVVTGYSSPVATYNTGVVARTVAGPAYGYAAPYAYNTPVVNAW